MGSSISREEFEILKSKINGENSYLQEENKRLELENKRLRNDLNYYSDIKDVRTFSKSQMAISKSNINKYVENLVENKETNIAYLPDFVERQIYRNIFGMALVLFEQVIDSTSLTILGHELSFNLHPEELTIDIPKEDRSPVAEV